MHVLIHIGNDWIAPVEEVDQEEVLRKELVKAQKKLKKQQQLQEWMREKEEKAMLVQKVHTYAHTYTYIHTITYTHTCICSYIHRRLRMSESHNKRKKMNEKGNVKQGKKS